MSYSITFQVAENICKFAKKGLTPSQIGVILRDSHGIAQVKSVTGSKILRILKAHGESHLPFLHWVYSRLYLSRMIMWFLCPFFLHWLRSSTWNPGGSLPSHQESCFNQKAFGEEQERQGFEVQVDFGGEQDPSPGSVLQEDKEASPCLEVVSILRHRRTRIVYYTFAWKCCIALIKILLSHAADL